MHCTRENNPLSLASVPELVGVFFQLRGSAARHTAATLKTHKRKDTRKMIETKRLKRGKSAARDGRDGSDGLDTRDSKRNRKAVLG